MRNIMVYEFIPIFILMNSKRIVMYQESCEKYYVCNSPETRSASF